MTTLVTLARLTDVGGLLCRVAPAGGRSGTIHRGSPTSTLSRDGRSSTTQNIAAHITDHKTTSQNIKNISNHIVTSQPQTQCPPRCKGSPPDHPLWVQGKNKSWNKTPVKNQEWWHCRNSKAEHKFSPIKIAHDYHIWWRLTGIFATFWHWVGLDIKDFHD